MEIELKNKQKMESALQEIFNKKDLMDIEETHFVGENDYRSILNEIPQNSGKNWRIIIAKVPILK